MNTVSFRNRLLGLMRNECQLDLIPQSVDNADFILSIAIVLIVFYESDSQLIPAYVRHFGWFLLKRSLLINFHVCRWRSYM